MSDALNLLELDRQDVPADLRPDAYFDFKAHPFAHQSLLEKNASVCSAILGIYAYATEWLSAALKDPGDNASVMVGKTSKPCHTVGAFEIVLDGAAVFEPARIIGASFGNPRHGIYVGAGTRVIGSNVYLEEGNIFIGDGTTVEPGAAIKGPAIIGKNSVIRQGAYVRENSIIGNDCVIRGEIKNAVLMDKACFPHPSYVGDSLCGHGSHFGNQATTANFGIYAGAVAREKQKSIVIQCGDDSVNLGTAKMGICMGDFCQVGCNAVSDPGTFLRPYTIVYALTRIPKGFYGPHEVLKNKPMEHGIIERVPLQPL